MDSATFNHMLLYRTPSTIRYTQDSPILPNVWIKFLTQPHCQHELILSMRHEHGAAKIAGELRQMLANYRKKLASRDVDGWDDTYLLTDPIEERARPRVAYIAGQIAVSVYFDELMRVVLPHTKWWHDTYDQLRDLENRDWDEASEAAKVQTEWEALREQDVGLFDRMSRKEFAERIKWKRAHLDDFGVTAEWKLFPQPRRDREAQLWPLSREDDLADALMILWEKFADERTFPVDHRAPFDKCKPERLERRRRYLLSIPFSLVWMVRTAGLIGSLFYSGIKPERVRTNDREASAGAPPDGELTSALKIAMVEEFKGERGGFSEALELRSGLVDHFTRLFREWDRLSPDSDGEYTSERSIWQITTNRRVHLAVHDSVKTVKADAAVHLFDISCAELTWAVIDSGIDADHPAFKDTSEKQYKAARRRLKATGRETDDLKVSDLPSRVVTAIDFTMLRSLLDCGHDDFAGDAEVIASMSDDQFADSLEDRRRNFFGTLLERAYRKPRLRGKSITQLEYEIADSEAKLPPNELKKRVKELAAEKDKVRRETIRVVKRITTDIYRGREIDWQIVEPALLLEAPEPPTNSHGTHVAGILGADWIEDLRHERSLPLDTRTRKMRGVCPDIKIMDVRVFSDEGLTDEFELIAALQYLRWLNMRAGTMKVAGANISMSLIHEVRRHACGQTPICKECDEASANGMVVVAAAGNRGFEMNDLGIISSNDHYKTVSITDPGNAETVITVGATHRKRPHEYGVSYFSSRGPTGDGRSKPDIVAPGEKIMAPVLMGRAGAKDGTSMAAPHVSGVAALLMARHTELIGKPAKVKAVLCETATDLGRERYFQGHGLVDGLRALQSI